MINSRSGSVCGKVRKLIEFSTFPVIVRKVCKVITFPLFQEFSIFPYAMW